jgi:hypothetical protein
VTLNGPPFRPLPRGVPHTITLSADAGTRLRAYARGHAWALIHSQGDDGVGHILVTQFSADYTITCSDSNSEGQADPHR